MPAFSGALTAPCLYPPQIGFLRSLLSAADRQSLHPWYGARLLVLLLALLIAPGRTVGQRIAPDPALAGLVIHAAAPTPQGWVWLATERGVFRYDGHRLVPLRALTAAGPRLSGQPFTAVLLDSAGTLWMGGPSGLFAFALATGRLRAVPLPLGRATRAGITALGQHDGALWIGANTDPLTVIRLDLRHSNRTPRVVLRYATGYISDFIPDSTGALLALGFQRSWRIGPAVAVVPLATRVSFHGSLQRPDGRRQWIPEGRHLPVPGQNGHWRIACDALYRVEPTGHERMTEHWPLTDFKVPRTLQIVELDSTWYWSAANQILSLSLRRGSGLPPQVRRAQAPLDFGRELVLVPVGGGTALLGFRRDGPGAVRIGPDRRTAERLAVAPSTALSTRAIGRLPDGRLFVSSYQGVFRQAADSPAAPLRRWRTAEQAGVWFANLSLPGGRRLLANELGHFDILGPDGHQTRLPWPQPHPRLIETNGLCLLRDAAGRYWGGTVAGLFEIDLARQQVRRYHETDPTFVLHRRRIEGLAEGPAGVLWVATAEGLYHLTVATGALVRYGPDEPPPRRLATANIRCLLVPHPDSV